MSKPKNKIEPDPESVRQIQRRLGRKNRKASEAEAKALHLLFRELEAHHKGRPGALDAIKKQLGLFLAEHGFRSIDNLYQIIEDLKKTFNDAPETENLLPEKMVISAAYAVFCLFVIDNWPESYDGNPQKNGYEYLQRASINLGGILSEMELSLMKVDAEIGGKVLANNENNGRNKGLPCDHIIPMIEQFIRRRNEYPNEKLEQAQSVVGKDFRVKSRTVRKYLKIVRDANILT